MKSLAIVAGLTCLVLAGCTTADHSARDQARTVFQVLREHEQAYQAALEAERVAISHTRAWAEASTEPQKANASGELDAATMKVTRLRKVFSGLAVRGRVRSELVDPIVSQLTKQEQELREIHDVLNTAEPEPLRALLERHGAPVNLFTPALRKLREVYGVARQRTWRGHPLTA